MTTILLTYYMLYIRKWNFWLVAGIVLVFSSIEFSFLIANIAKIKERWMFLVFEAGIFLVMYAWYYGRKANNKLVKFVQLGQYTRELKELSDDDAIPKFATHLIYLSKANNREQVEEKVIKSIFSKRPKRADVYWFLHLNRTDEPYTLKYNITELADDKVIKVTIDIGFRIQPRTELYFKKIVQELVANKELNLHIRPDGSTKYNAKPDFKFVVIEKFLSVENEFSLREGLLLNTYFKLKQMGQRDEAAFGLDKSDVVVEHIPLLYQPVQQIELTRTTK